MKNIKRKDSRVKYIWLDMDPDPVILYGLILARYISQEKDPININTD